MPLDHLLIGVGTVAILGLVWWCGFESGRNVQAAAMYRWMKERIDVEDEDATQ